jgi:NAD+ kinase
MVRWWERMAKIGIVVNLAKDPELISTKSIIDWLKKQQCEILLSNSIAEKMENYLNGYDMQYVYEKADFIIVLGGDGTMLGTARNVANFGTPILGINMGHLGFMTDVEATETFEALEKLLNGNYILEERMMIEATVINGDETKASFYCLNEIEIARGTLSKMITLKICINSQYFDSYNADGILISTPTGSTAYSLSAGGPIITPNVKVMLITPICPHSLSARSLVVSEEEIIEASIINSFHDAFLTIDGQIGYNISEGDKIIIKKSEYVTKLVKVSNRSFYDILKTKLKERFI